MTEKYIPSAEAQMLIRKPAAEVFEAFIDPAITKHFWFTRSGGKLESGKNIRWDWDMYNVSINVFVKEIVPHSRIVIEWDEPSTTVEFNFRPLTDGSTYVTIRNSGFHKTGNELIDAIKDSTGGFTTVLDGLKAYLEYNIELNLIDDKFQKEAVRHGN